MDKELLKSFIAGQIRHGVTLAAGALIANGALANSDSASFVQIGSGLVMWVLMAGWSWWQKDGQAEVADALKRLTGRSNVVAAVAVAQGYPPAAPRP